MKICRNCTKTKSCKTFEIYGAMSNKAENCSNFEEKLKPCPFCGGEAIVGDYTGEQISCPKCHVGIKINLPDCQYVLHNGTDFNGYEVVYQAIQIWNTRKN